MGELAFLDWSLHLKRQHSPLIAPFHIDRAVAKAGEKCLIVRILKDQFTCSKNYAEIALDSHKTFRECQWR